MHPNIDQIIHQEAIKSIPEKCALLQNTSKDIRQKLSQAIHSQLTQPSPELQSNLELLTKNPQALLASMKHLSEKELQGLHQAIEKNWPPIQNSDLELNPQISSIPKLELKELDFGDELNEAFDLIDFDHHPTSDSADKPINLDFISLKTFYELISAHYYVNHVSA